MSGSNFSSQPDGSAEPTVELPWSPVAAPTNTSAWATPAPPPVPAATVTPPPAAPILAATPIEPWPAPPPTAAAAARRRRWPVPAQLLVLVSVVAASAVFGYTTYRTVAGVELSAHGWSEVSAWSWGILAGAVATLVAAVVTVVALIRTQSSRLIAVISLIVAIFLPPIALYAGGRLGFDIAAATLSTDIVSFTTDGAAGMLLTWLMQLIGE